MSQQSLAQRRAAHALKRIEAHRDRNKGKQKPDYGNYVSYTQSLPATILMNGLGQALATLLSKAEGDLKKPHGLLYSDLQDWLCGSDPAAPYSKASGGEKCLMEAIIKNDEQAYLKAQTEAFAYLVWLKKFANAYLEKGKDDDDHPTV